MVNFWLGCTRHPFIWALSSKKLPNLFAYPLVQKNILWPKTDPWASVLVCFCCLSWKSKASYFLVLVLPCFSISSICINWVGIVSSNWLFGFCKRVSTSTLIAWISLVGHQNDWNMEHLHYNSFVCFLRDCYTSESLSRGILKLMFLWCFQPCFMLYQRFSGTRAWYHFLALLIWSWQNCHLLKSHWNLRFQLSPISLELPSFFPFFFWDYITSHRSEFLCCRWKSEPKLSNSSVNYLAGRNSANVNNLWN